MKIAERIVMVLIALALIGGGVGIYVSVENKRQAVKDAVARGEYEIRPEVKPVSTSTENWREFYPVVVPIVIGTTTVYASVADSMNERIKGLSDTPYLPEGVVKLFAFGSGGEQSIWMKDMNYPLDIIWTDKGGSIVHIEERVTPDTYPKSFSSPTPAWYVIEANAGFVESILLKRGDEVIIPKSE